MAGMIGAASFLAAIALLHLLKPSVDPGRSFVSDLAHGRFGMVLTLAFILVGLLLLALAYGLAVAVRHTPELGAATGFFFLGALGFATLAFFPTDPRGAHVTWRGEVHAWVSSVSFLLLLFALALYTWAFMRDPRWRGHVRLSFGLTLTTGVALVPLSPMHMIVGLEWSRAPMAVRGFLERLAILSAVAWILVTSWQLWKAPHAAEPQAARPVPAAASVFLAAPVARARVARRRGRRAKSRPGRVHPRP